MDVINRRMMIGRLLAQMAGSLDGWKLKKVVYNGVSTTNGDQVHTWLKSVKPTATIIFCYVMSACEQTPEINNQFVCAFAINNIFVNGSVGRYRDNSYASAQFGSIYDVVLNNGDEVIFLYLE